MEDLFNVNLSFAARSSLQAGQQLNVNQELISPDGRAVLLLQGDGNLVLYRNDTGQALWSSNTSGKPVTHAILQSDGT